ncbi:hypothetical protein [Salisediminibacterium halotolerans]|uniref:Uncharacterized protein n=1 Tax=Salisediminibacterium halotolerans TaxID=517425 RepID=A0A1H9QU98_9BACI|nr:MULTISPECIES: hypothetical protein [Salisediminibacterium]RLJ69632.1 hypothetical protein BCL39_2496 [Actinophytocola xinjiangensis]RPE89690.1 hypothetical protein EDD67_0467 [Salisediminibacterium halotolerans]TWG32526.1 hypothetical protein BCL52_2491 [Salisediminibacterium halotolerans]SER64028.1 hypothetical protein SAMN05444126_103138 [Salisediminibacterium haloalkalitolerans]GEL09225.1 hypothetical protein SHA02_26410 [Salisediminibacterium halotolerans]
MACVNGDGKLTQSAKDLLEALDGESKSAKQLAAEVDMPVFQIRSSLRDANSMGFVTSEDNEAYTLTDGGRKMLKHS